MSTDAPLAPSWLPRQQRRRVDRELRRLIGRDDCSICNSPLEHNSRTASGLDAQGNVVVAGECCMSRVATVFGLGLYYSRRQYDFLTTPKKSGSGREFTCEQVADAVAVTQSVVAKIEKRLDDVGRRSGNKPRKVGLLDAAWKDDDRDWFARNPARSHRSRMPFPGEVEEEKAATPAGHVLILLVRQVEPGWRLKAGFYLPTHALPVPDNEAVTHALFEVATQREPMPRDAQAFWALIDKYTAITG